MHVRTMLGNAEGQCYAAQMCCELWQGFYTPEPMKNKTILMPILVKNKTYFLLIDIITSVNKIKVMQLCFSKKEIKKL